MKSRIKYIVYSILIFLLFPIVTLALDYPEVDSKIVEIYDLTDKKVIYEVKSKEQSSIASLTKIVTTITAIETIEDLDKEVTITQEILNTVRWDASKAGLKAGDKLTYRDLLYASMLPSGADATNSIAILSSGSIDNFVTKMNNLVDKIGLTNTHFVNVTGLDTEGHYSTADEVRQILEYALKNELFRKIYTTYEYTLSNDLTVTSTLSKYSSSSKDTIKILGSKTGFTKDAGYCLSSLSNINSHEFLIIVLQAEHIDSKYYNIVDTLSLISFLLDNYKDQILVSAGDLIKTIPVKLSNIDSYDIKASEDVTLYLPSDYDKDKIKVEYKGKDNLSFINKEDSKIGTITYYYDNNKIAEDDVYLNTKIEMNISKVIQEYIYVVIIVPVLLIATTILLVKKKKH